MTSMHFVDVFGRSEKMFHNGLRWDCCALITQMLRTTTTTCVRRWWRRMVSYIKITRVDKVHFFIEGSLILSMETSFVDRTFFFKIYLPIVVSPRCCKFFVCVWWIASDPPFRRRDYFLVTGLPEVHTHGPSVSLDDRRVFWVRYASYDCLCSAAINAFQKWWCLWFEFFLSWLSSSGQQQVITCHVFLR